MPTVPNNRAYLCVRASFKNLRIFVSSLYISLCTMIFKRYNQNFWGPLFVGAPGQLPTLPSLKSGHDAKFIHEALDNALKEVLPKVKRTKSPWISQETLSLADQKREATNKRDQSEESLHTYRQLCNNVRTSARGDKERWLRDKCEDIEKTPRSTRAVKCTNW